MAAVLIPKRVAVTDVEESELFVDVSEAPLEGAETKRLFVKRFVRTAGAAAGRCPVLCVHGLTRNGGDFYVLARQLAHLGFE